MACLLGAVLRQESAQISGICTIPRLDWYKMQTPTGPAFHENTMHAPAGFCKWFQIASGCYIAFLLVTKVISSLIGMITLSSKSHYTGIVSTKKLSSVW